MSLRNTQPFLGAEIAFAHNGSVKEFHPETSHVPIGTTDSERVFAAFIDRYKAIGDVEGALTALLEDEIRGHTYTGLVFLISDGSHLYGYRDYGEGNDGNYYNLRYLSSDDRVVVYQQSISRDAAQAIQVERGSLIRIGFDLEVDIRKLC